MSLARDRTQTTKSDKISSQHSPLRCQAAKESLEQSTAIQEEKPDFHEDPKASDGQSTAQRGQLCQVRGVTQAKEQRMSTNSSPHGVGQSLPGSSRKCTRQGRGNHKGPPAAVTLWATHQWTNTHGDSVLINSPGCIRRCAYQYPTQAQHTCQ